MKKLVCDRCGRELIEMKSIDQAFEGFEAWSASRKAGGGEARGIFPCEHYLNCGGEMVLVDDRGNVEHFKWVKKILRR